MADERSSTPTKQVDSQDKDTFEDAEEMTTPKAGKPQSPNTPRSLTGRRSSAASTASKIMNGGLANGHATDKSGESPEASKPLPTSANPDRISTASMTDVNLAEGSQNGDAPALPTRSSNDLSPVSSNQQTHTIKGLSGPMSIPDMPPPQHPAQKQPIPSPAPSSSRKFAPFSWLSRATTSGDKQAKSPLPSPPASERRGTMSSIASGSMDLHLNRIDGESGQASLKDRFKTMRMREEAGITLEQEQGAQSPGILGGLLGRSVSNSGGPGSPPLTAGGESSAETPALARSVSSPGSNGPSRQQTINTNLPPGTASGMASAPPMTAVDWDLWQSVVYEGPAAVARTSPEELTQAIANGIPQAIRGVVWQVLAKSKNDDLESLYRELVARGSDKPNGTVASSSDSTKESNASSASSIRSGHSTPASPPKASQMNDDAISLNASLLKIRSAKEDPAKIQKLEKTIKRDLGARTSFSKYLMASGLQEGLFGICKAYALYDEAVGYAQGMNFIAMPLLFNMPEEEAFSLFVRLMSKYGLRELFTDGMPGLHLHLYQFERLLEDLEPAVYCHLHRRGVNPQLYATQWFLTLFAYRFPLQLVVRVYDLILSEGLEGAILKFGVALMRKNRETLLEMRDMVALTTFLKEKLFDAYIDKAPSSSSLLESGFFGSASGIDKEVYRADGLVQDACAIQITPETLKLYTTEYEDKVRLEAARESEIDSLRTLTTSQATRIKILEQAREKSDTEHVSIASDLVRTKVDNEQLLDDNETLKGQVEELRRVVERQTEEVEARLKGEMDAVMARNIEVHNANRAMEDEKAEMEKELVGAKMSYAEIHSELDNLKQKWRDVQLLMKEGK